MAGYTEHYQLHQWDAGDDFLRTDFNEDFAKIDTALGTLAENVEVGSYVGDGTDSREIQLAFAPKFVFVMGYINSGAGFSFLIPGMNYYLYNNSMGYNLSANLTLDGDKLVVRSGAYQNQSGRTTYYVAFR